MGGFLDNLSITLGLLSVGGVLFSLGTLIISLFNKTTSALHCIALAGCVVGVLVAVHFQNMARSRQRRPMRDSEESWKFASDEDTHIIRVNASFDGKRRPHRFKLEIFADGKLVTKDAKESAPQDGVIWKPKYTFEMDGHVVILFVDSQRIQNSWGEGFEIKFSLSVDGQHIPALTEHTPIALTLPPACPECHAPIGRQTVRWSGPLQAVCPYCGANIRIAARNSANRGKTSPNKHKLTRL